MNQQNTSLKAAIVQNFTAVFLAIMWIISLVVVLHVMHFPEAKDEMQWATGMSSGWITAIGVALKTSGPPAPDPPGTSRTVDQHMAQVIEPKPENQTT